jgi:ferredoxin
VEVIVDPELCTGHGRCYSLEPELFDADPAGYGTVRTAVDPASLGESAENAVRNCPEGAVRITAASKPDAGGPR